MQKQQQSANKSQQEVSAYCYEKWFKDLLKGSSILNKEGLQLLIEWMPWSVQKIVLKFKASSHQFRMYKYFETCGGLQNVIVIAKTTHGKILGGFTPLSFYPASGKWEYEEDYAAEKLKDESNTSFVFSLSERQKFNIIEDHYAIIRWSNKNCILFFGALGLGDVANYCRYNTLTLKNDGYDTSKYPNSKQSFLKLTGQQKTDFLTAQWQVYQVQWK